MDRKRTLHWAALIGLITALVTLGTVALALYQQLGESRRQEQALQQQAARDRAAYDAQRERDEALHQRQLEAQRQAAIAVEHSRLCDEHATRRSAIEARFSSLMESHGTLMNAIRGCTRERTADDRQGCLATVCIGAAIWTNGQANCLVIVADGAAIKEDIERENRAAAADACPVPVSSIIEFFN